MNGGSATWGVAEGTFALRDLHSGYRQAMQALEIGSIIHGEGRVTDAAHSTIPDARRPLSR